MTRLSCLLPGLATALALLTILAARPAAHPTSTTAVTIEVTADREARVRFVADADALLAKLDAASAPAALEERLRDQSVALLDRLALTFDGRRAALRLQRLSVDAEGLATLHLLAPAAEARVLTWQTSLVLGAYPMVVRVAHRPEVVRWLQGPETSEPFELRGVSSTRALGTGVWLGFTHIVPYGLDHILFVVGLFLLSAGGRQLFWQVTAFTLAHSVTLGLGLYGWVSIPAAVVEPLIALSVAYVGIENVLTERLRSWRVVVVFVFGLLHGLGFAEGVARLALSPADLLVTLVSFNVGVELGQLTVIAAAAFAVRIMVGLNASWRQPVTRAASAGIGAAGLFWVVTRLASP